MAYSNSSNKPPQLARDFIALLQQKTRNAKNKPCRHPSRNAIQRVDWIDGED